MAEIVKPNMNLVWASGGALIAPSNTKVQQGWTSEIPPHQWENWVQNRQDACLLYLMQKGIPEWDNSTEYWANRSFVQRSGNLYKAIRNNINADPLTSGSDWTNAIPSATTTVAGLSARATSAEVITGTNDTKHVTPKTLQDKLDSPTTGYLKASNNLSEITNAATARANLDIRASSTVTAGLVRISTAAESTSRTSEVTALSPAGLGRNIQNSLNDATSGRLMTVGAFGLGGSTTTPPNGRLNLNPMGWYYQAIVTPFGGGSFFLELPYSNTVGGMRLSNNPYSDRYFLNSWDRDNATYRQAVEIWHSGNFDPANYALKDHTHTIAQVIGLQTALDNKQSSLGYSPVNKAGDTMTGNLQVSGAFGATGNVSSSTALYAGNITSWGTGTFIEPTNITFGNGSNRYRWAHKGSEILLERLTGTNTLSGQVLRVADDDIVNFQNRPVVGGRSIAYVDEAPTTWNSVGACALLFNNGTTQFSPGAILSGSNLYVSNTAGDTGGTVPGTWRCQGYVPGSSSISERVTIWQRIS